MVEEERGEPSAARRGWSCRGEGSEVSSPGSSPGRRRSSFGSRSPTPSVSTIELNAPPRRRSGFASRRGRAAGERLTGLGARHSRGLRPERAAGRASAPTAATPGPTALRTCSRTGGIPQGDYAPAPWLLSSAGWALWSETGAPGCEFDLAERVVVLAAGRGRAASAAPADRSPRRRRGCATTCASPGSRPCFPSGPTGTGRAATSTGTSTTCVDDFEGYVAHALPLDAIVIDSPWETQYNTWRFNPHPVSRPGGPDRAACAATGVRTVVWVTPWVNLDSADGQYPSDPETERLHRRPAPNYAEGAVGRPLRARCRRSSPGSAAGGWAPARWSTSPHRRHGAGGGAGAGRARDGGRGHQGRRRRGLLLAARRPLRGRAHAAPRRRGITASLYRETMQEVLDEVHPAEGVLFGRCGWTGQQATGMTWGGDQASDFWSLRTLVAATLTAAASGFSNWSHDVGGYLGSRLVERCPRELLLRWAQFGCFTPLMQAHGRFEQEAWRYDPRTLELLPRLRAAARAAGSVHPRRGSDRRALRAADHPPAVPHRPRDPADGRSPMPTCSGRRCGWPRCSRRAQPSGRSTSRGAVDRLLDPRAR